MFISLIQSIQNDFNQFNAISLYRYRHNLMSKLRRNRCRFIILILISIILAFYAFGLYLHPFELDFETRFEYPLHMADFRYFVEIAKQNVNNNVLKPINNYSYHYHLNPKHKCFGDSGSQNSNSSLYPITLLLVIKSATCNFLIRNVIRQTWGFENRFSDVTIRTVFMLGNCQNSETICENTFQKYSNIVFSRKSDRFRSLFQNNKTVNCQQVIDMENEFYDDIIQADFIDSYYNNTRKTMASLHWTVQYCSHVPFMFFVDDDYYVSIKNLLKFSRNYLQIVNQISSVNNRDNNNEYDGGVDSDDEDRRLKTLALNNEKFDGRLYAGFVFSYSRPQRHIMSKWYVDLDEYPYNRYPPYVTGGCFLINNHTAIDLYYSSLFTKPFKYDDVYLGILANKMKINLIANNERMHFYKLKYDQKLYRPVLASHGYHDPYELWKVWNEQKSLGNA